MRLLISVLVLDLLSRLLTPGGFVAPFEAGTRQEIPSAIAAPFAVDTQFAPWITDGDGSIHSVVVQPDGKTILAGGFSYLTNGRPTSGIARLNTDGTLDASFMNGLLGANAGVRAVALQNDGKMIVGGFFTAMNGVQRSMLVRLNADGSVDPGFMNGAAGFNDAPLAIAVQPDGKILVGGQFTSVNGTQRSRLVRLNSNGSVDSAFMTGLSGPNGAVNAITHLSSGQMLIGGSFTNVNGTSRGGLARVNSDGSLDAGFLSGFNVGGSAITSIGLQADGKIVIGGDFQTVLGQTFRRIARLTSGGALDAFSNLGFDNTVNSIAIQTDGKVVVGGTFTAAGTATFRRIARLLADGTPDLTFLAGGSGANNSVNALALLTDGRTIAAGSFTDLSGNPRSLVARLNTQGVPDSAVNPQFSGMIGVVRDSLVEPDGKILIVGSFTKVNGVFRRRIARLSPDGSLDATFLAGYTGLEGPEPVSANAVARQVDGRILVGGAFLGANGETRKGVARLDTSGTVDASFFCNLNGPTAVPQVNAVVAQADGKIVIGGRFTSVDGLSRSNLARLHSNGSVDTTFMSAMSGANGEVLTIAPQQNGRIVIGGLFTSFNGQPRAFIARADLDGSLDSSFTGGTNGSVWSAAALSNGQVIIGGEFTEANGTARGRLARLNSNGTTDLGFMNGQSGANASVWEAVVQPDGTVVAGGSFTGFNGVQTGRLARLDANGLVDTSFMNGAGANEGVYAIALQSRRSVYVGGSFTSFSGLAHGGFTRLRGSGPPLFDYDGDVRADLSVRRPSDNIWYLLRGTAGFTAITWGEAGDRMAPADYDGDGKTDVAVFRPSTGQWFVVNSSNLTFVTYNWGQNGDLPVPTDRDNDGRSDLVLFRPGDNTLVSEIDGDGAFDSDSVWSGGR